MRCEVAVPVRDFLSVIKEISFDELRADALLAPKLLVVAPDEEQAERCRDLLFGRQSEPYVTLYVSGTPGAASPDPLRFDCIISVGPLDPMDNMQWRDLFNRAGETVRIVEISPTQLYPGSDLSAKREQIADVADERSLAIGRYIDLMREPCASHAITETSMANAQFALISNIPTLVPVVGNLVAVGADFVVLTKNQLMLIYKLAAIFGRDMDNRWQIYTEMMPVVGSGLMWRTVARELSDLLPFAMGTVPKVAIAYAGTYSTGQAARFYYEHGTKIDRKQMQALYKEALALMKRTPLQLPWGSRGEDDVDDSDDAVHVKITEHPSASGESKNESEAEDEPRTGSTGE